MASIPPLPNDNTIATRGVDYVVRKPAPSASELPGRSLASGLPLKATPQRATIDPGAVLAPDLAKLLAAIDLVAGGTKAEVDWPAPAGVRADGAVAETPEQALAALRTALADSPLFTVRRMTERWFPAAAARLDARRAADAVRDAASSPSMSSLQTDAGSPAEAAGRPPPTPENAFTPADRPQPRDLAQAAALMIGGRLQWQGELTPGVQARLVREDHWQTERESGGSGPQAGTRFTLTVDLPHLGVVTLQAVDIPGAASIDVFAEPLAAARLEGDLGRLKDRMRRMHAGATTVAIRSSDKAPRR